jgi:hypothetical protein
MVFSKAITSVSLITLLVYAPFGGFFFIALQLQVIRIVCPGSRHRPACDDAADADVVGALGRAR